MSDQPQHSNPVPWPARRESATEDRCQSWEAHAVFRETYLHLYPEEDLRAAYRRIGVALYDQALAYEETYKPRGEVPIKGDLRAAVRDLRQLQGYLHHLGADPSGLEPGGLDPGDVEPANLIRLFALALDVADQLGAQAIRLEAMLGAPVGAPVGVES